MANKIWYQISILFLAYNLYLLCEEGNELNYKFINETKTEIESLQYAVCLQVNELNEFHRFVSSKNRSINYSEENFNVNHFLIQSVQLLNDELFEVEGLNDVFRLQKSYVFNKYACYLMNYKYLKIINLFSRFNYRLYAYLDDRRWFFHYYIYENFATGNQLTSLKFYKLTIQYNELVNFDPDKFECLNECLKKRSRKSIYLYEWNDTEPIDLTENGTTEFHSNNNNTSGEKDCDEKCNKRSTILTYVLVVIRTEYRIGDEKKYRPMAMVIDVHFETYPSYSTFEFLLQFIGLITLFINVNVNDSLLPLFRSIFGKYFRARFFQKVYPKIKIALLIFSLIVVIEAASFMIDDYYYQSEYPIETKIMNYSLSPVPFSLVFCVPIKHLIFSSNSTDLAMNISDREILSNYSYETIENYTNSDLKQSINKIYVSYGNKRTTIDNFKISKNVYFRNCNYSTDYGAKKINLFSRCFLIKFNIKENKYQSLLTISNLVLSTKNTFNNVYLLEQSEPFSSKSFLLEGDYKILLKRYKKSKYSKKSNCTDYPKSKYLMVDECINRKFLTKYQNFTTHAVLNKKQFKSFIFQFKYFNDTLDRDIVDECLEKFKSIGCRLNVFRSSFSRILRSSDRLEQNLYFEIVEYNESEVSFWKLALNILNLESIFFGTNAMKILLTVFFVIIRLIFRLKWHKIFRHVIFAVCFLFFLVHIQMVFKSIVFSDLNQNAYYQKNDTISFPDLNLCFKIFENRSEKELDPNYRLTAKSLDKLSVKMETRIDRISYMINGSFIDFNPFKDKNELFEINYFMYHNIKCIEIKFYLVYREADLYFIDDPYVLKIFFKNKSIKSTTRVYFLTKKRQTKQFNQIYKLDLNCSISKCNAYQIVLEQFEISIMDRFKYIKNPRALFVKEIDINDATSYLDNMQNNFKSEFNLQTRAIPFHQFDDVEIDDELFKQYFSQVQNVSDHYYPHNLNLNFEIYTSYINKIAVHPDLATFEFYPSFQLQKTVITSDSNYAKLIQNILNTLSLWVNICILDMSLYINKSLKIFVLFYDVLIILKLKLKQQIL